MIIDCHTHLGSNDNITARVEDLLRSMDEAGIDVSLAFAGSINGCPTADLLEEIEPHRDRIRAVGAVELDHFTDLLASINHSAAETYMSFLNHPNVVAAKFYLGYEHFYPDGYTVHSAMRYIRKHRKVAIFHTGDCFYKIKDAKLKYAHPLGIDDVATDFRDVNVVLAHMGWPWVRDAAEVCYKNPNAYADVSGFTYGAFSDDGEDLRKFRAAITEFCDIAGPGKLLFGTDWPISDQSSYVEVVRGLGLMDAMWHNAERVFGL